MFTFRTISSSLALMAALLLAAVPASAGPLIPFDDGDAVITDLGADETFGEITAFAFEFNSLTGTWVASTLIGRNETNDFGLGVCSSAEFALGSNACGIGNAGGSGDINELSNEEQNEAILLTLDDGYLWTDLWVSSLDSMEAGSFFFGASTDVATLLTGAVGCDFAATPAGGTNFTPESAGSVNGTVNCSTADDLWGTNLNVLFVPNQNDIGGDNDYLVYGAGTIETTTGGQIPEPATLLLIGTGLVAVGARQYRRRQTK